MMSDVWIEQQPTIFEAAWRGRDCRCPDDNAIVNIERPVRPDRTFIIAECPRCGKRLVMGPRDDPKSSMFRPWLDEEKMNLVDQYFSKQMLHCPVDGAPLNTEEPGVLDVQGRKVHIRCDRCRQSHFHIPITN